MKIFKFLTAAFTTLMLVVSCDDGFEETNANIDDPVTVPSDMLIGTIVRNMGNTLYSTFNNNEIGETWIQHESLIQYNDPERYRPRISSMDAIWANFYREASTANQMYRVAVEEGNEVNQGIALVLKAYCFSVLTDLYGDVPFSEALLGPSESNFAPVYDKQEDVYNGVIDLLDQAIPLLGGSGGPAESLDIMYAGDASKWRNFAASLKFRTLMRISNKTNVSGELTALYNGGNLFSSKDEEAKLVYLATAPEANPMFETIVDGNRAEHGLADTFINYLLDTNDPRIEAFAQEAANGGYVGKPNGYSVTPVDGFSYDDVSQYGTLYLEPTAPAYFVSYTELLFLIAEAAKKGYIPGGDGVAETYYEAGIANSFEENNVTGFDDFIAQSSVAYTSNSALEKIGYQKWVALLGQGFEAWTEWRRSIDSTHPNGIPALELAIEPFEQSIPSRLKYNGDEISVNTANYKAAVASQGPDELTTKVWFMN